MKQVLFIYLLLFILQIRCNLSCFQWSILDVFCVEKSYVAPKRGPFQNDSWKITSIFENEIPSNMFLAFLFLSFRSAF